MRKKGKKWEEAVARAAERYKLAISNINVPSFEPLFWETRFPTLEYPGDDVAKKIIKAEFRRAEVFELLKRKGKNV